MVSTVLRLFFRGVIFLAHALFSPRLIICLDEPVYFNKVCLFPRRRPDGNPLQMPQFCALGNRLLARSVILIRILQFKGGQWLLEQPGSSMVPQCRRMQQLAGEFQDGPSVNSSTRNHAMCQLELDVSACSVSCRCGAFASFRERMEQTHVNPRSCSATSRI